MFDQVTMTLNVDPYIRSALQEDITSEDVSTNSVMPEAKLGEVDLICKQDVVYRSSAVCLRCWIQRQRSNFLQKTGTR